LIKKAGRDKRKDIKLFVTSVFDGKRVQKKEDEKRDKVYD
jgi:hypothetical protein